MSFGYFVCKDGSPPNPSFSAQDYICNQKQKTKKKKNHLAQEGELCIKLPSFLFFLTHL